MTANIFLISKLDNSEFLVLLKGSRFHYDQVVILSARGIPNGTPMQHSSMATISTQARNEDEAFEHQQHMTRVKSIV